MKKYITLYFLLIASAAFSQTETFTISGNIIGLDVNKMYYYVKDNTAPKGYVKDSFEVKDGAFSYSTAIKEMTYITINTGVERVVKKVDRGYIPAKSSLLQFIAFPGANIHFTGEITDFVNAYPSGDPANDDLAKLNKEINPLVNESVNLYLKIARKEVSDSSEIKKINTSTEKLSNEVLSKKQQFIRNNPSSSAAAWLLSDMMLRKQLTDDTAIALFSSLNKEKLTGVTFYTDAAQRISGMGATAIGKTAPDINSIHTFDGKKFELSSLRGKYVIIDFWGTWCMPCVSGMPKMKEYLSKHKDKLDIVGVAQESDNGILWKKFITTHPEYNWHQVLNRDDEDYILKYNVAGFPTKIVLDPEGKILGRFVGEDEGFYKKLDDLLK